MKTIKAKVLKCTLTVVAASCLSLQAVQALADDQQIQENLGQTTFPSPTEAWESLQDVMSDLSTTPSLESLLNAQGSVATCQSAFAQNSTKSDRSLEFAIAAANELLNASSSNPAALESASLSFGDFESVLLNVRRRSVNPEASSAYSNGSFYQDTQALWDEIERRFTDVENFLALNLDALNIDPLAPATIDPMKGEIQDYNSSLKKFHKKIHDYKKAQLQDAVSVAGLSAEEQQLWNQFQLTLSEKSKAACKSFRSQIPSNEEVRDARQLQNNLAKTESIEATMNVFKLLKEGCTYEFLNVLLTKRNDQDSSLNSFHQLQIKLNQFLNNIDLNNPVTALQAQVDMLAYEKEVAIVTIAK